MVRVVLPFRSHRQSLFQVTMPTWQVMEAMHWRSWMSQTHQPRFMRTVHISINRQVCTVFNNYAYVASQGADSLEIVDVANPAAPVWKGRILHGTGGALLNDPISVYVSGNYAYVASSGSNALEIVDITNPSAPVHAGSIVFSPSRAQSVYVSGNYAYVVISYGSSKSLEIMDITNPASRFIRAAYQTV